MCRYGDYGPYKSHFACFACRKAFKQPPIVEWLAMQGLDYAYSQLSRVWWKKKRLRKREEELGVRLDDLCEMYAARPCPQCGEQMADMGLDFRPPRHADKKAWRILQGMYRVGHAFHTCGCNGPGWIPSSPADYRRYLESRRKAYNEQLEQMQSASDRTTEEKHEAGIYWSDRIARIEVELKSLA